MHGSALLLGFAKRSDTCDIVVAPVVQASRILTMNTYCSPWSLLCAMPCRKMQRNVPCVVWVLKKTRAATRWSALFVVGRPPTSSLPSILASPAPLAAGRSTCTALGVIKPDFHVASTYCGYRGQVLLGMHEEGGGLRALSGQLCSVRRSNHQAVEPGQSSGLATVRPSH